VRNLLVVKLTTVAVQPQTRGIAPCVTARIPSLQASMVVDITAGTQREQNVSRSSGRGGKCYIRNDS